MKPPKGAYHVQMNQFLCRSCGRIRHAHVPGDFDDDGICTAVARPIGFLYGGSVLCPQCADRFTPQAGDDQATPLYRINIGQYRQTCHACGTVMLEGHEDWLELFSPKPDQADPFAMINEARKRNEANEEAADMEETTGIPQPATLKLGLKFEQIIAWIKNHGFTKDAYGHYQKALGGETYRYKLTPRRKPIMLRLEIKGSLGWIRLRSGYFQKMAINPETGKLIGMKR